MRYLKLASAKNPYNDFIELNDFNGFLCTSFQPLGISRKLNFLQVKNRQFIVENTPHFKNYSLTIEILSKYSEYEAKYRELTTFLDRNKKEGFRLYFAPQEKYETRYCLCNIETSTKTEKMQPVVLVLSQCSLWLGNETIKRTAQVLEEGNNLFAFSEENGYYSANFAFDEKTNNYCIEFFGSVSTEVVIENRSYNEIPLNMKIYGPCINPTLLLFEEGNNNPIKRLKIDAKIDDGYYVYINSKIGENGVWYVNNSTGEKIDYTSLVDNSFGSPYVYIENGNYKVRVVDDGYNACLTDIFYQEEYSE